MIKNSIHRQLDILFMIVKKNATNLAEIAEELDVPKRSVKDAIAKLNQAFDDTFNLPQFILSSYQGIISINPLYQNEAIKFAYKLKLHLLEEQVIFRYCILLVTRDSLTKCELVDTLFISEAYLSKLTQQLNHFLLKFDLTIRIENGRYRIIGVEFNLRLFSYLLLHDSYQNLEWPFSTTTIAEIRQGLPEKMQLDAYKHSHTKRHSFYVIHEVLNARIRHGHFVELSKPFRSLLQMFQTNKSVYLIFEEDSEKNLSHSQRQSEEMAFNFMCHILVSDEIPRQDKVSLGTLFNKESHPFCKQAREICERFSTIANFSFTEEKQALYLYYITLLLLLYFLIGEQLEYFLTLFIPRPTFHLRTNNSQIQKIRELVDSMVPDPVKSAFISSLLYSLTHSEQDTQVKIYLQMTKDFTAIYVIRNRLRALYSDENIQISEDYSISDIVITDILESVETADRTIFYLDSVNNEKAWEHLFNLICKTYLKKLNIVSEN